MKRFLALLLGATLSAAAAADIGLSTPRLELTGRPGETLTASVTVLTSETASQHVRVTVSDFTLDPGGEITFLPPGGVVTSASPWLTLESSDVHLVAGVNREFRLSVTIPDDPRLEGTYRSMVFFTVVPPTNETTGVGVVTTTRIGLAVYVTVRGTERTGGELLDMYLGDNGNLNVVVANTGNTLMRLGGVVELRDETGLAAHTLQIPALPVLRESERRLDLPLPTELKPGFYVALTLIQDSRGGVLVGELPLTVP